MRFAIYTPATREIRTVVECPEHQIDASLLQGEEYVEVGQDVSDLTHQIINGLPVAYAQHVAAAKADRPRYPAMWQNSTCTWADLRSLEQVKAAQWEIIKQAREFAIDGPVSTPWGVFDGDAVSRANIDGTVAGMHVAIASGYPDRVTWTLADNSAVDLTVAQLEHVGLLMLLKVQGAYDMGRILRASIESAVSRETVLAITWPA